MAEENKKSKSIGELFVEFGSEGTPDLIKSLNKVSAQFLLTKNAAEQFLRPIINMAKQAGNTGVQIGKMSSALGTSYQEFQKLKIQLNRMNIDEGVINNISDLQGTLYDLFHGFGGLPPGLNLALDRLGLNIMDYDESLDGTLNLIKDMEKASKNLGMSDLDYQSVLRQAGLPADLGYARNRGGISNITDFRTISDKEVEQLIKLQESMNKLKTSTDSLKNSIIARLSPIITKSNEGTTRLVDGNASKAEKQVATADIIGGAVGGAVIGFVLAGPIGAVGGTLTGGLAGAQISGLKAETAKDIKNSDFWEWVTAKTDKSYPKWKEEQNEQFTGGAASLFLGEENAKKLNEDLRPSLKEIEEQFTPKRLNPESNGILEPIKGDNPAAMPANMSNIIQNINISNDIKIQGDNSREVASQIAEIDRQAIEYTQYQVSNIPGI